MIFFFKQQADLAFKQAEKMKSEATTKTLDEGMNEPATVASKLWSYQHYTLLLAQVLLCSIQGRGGKSFCVQPSSNIKGMPIQTLKFECK